jgi:hypothetical protein
MCWCWRQGEGLAVGGRNLGKAVQLLEGNDELLRLLNWAVFGVQQVV